MNKNNPKAHSTGSVVAAVLHDLLRDQSFDSLADLADALKQRLTRHRVPWTNDEVNDALRIVEHRRPLLARERHDGEPGAELPPVEPITRWMAPATLRELMQRYVREHPDTPKPSIKSMPPAPEPMTQRDADHRKALDWTLRELQASIDRCRVLEAAALDAYEKGDDESCDD